MSKYILLVLASVAVFAAQGQTSVYMHRQKKVDRMVLPGNYSGIAALGNGRYAVVSDKSEREGFFLFRIDVDSVTGAVLDVENETFVSIGSPNRDIEGVAVRGTHIYIGGESDNVVKVCLPDGTPTDLSSPCLFPSTQRNAGLESLTYDGTTDTFWTMEEWQKDGRLTLVQLDSMLHPIRLLHYQADQPIAKARRGLHAVGVSELCVMPDGRLLSLEREVSVPRRGMGAWCLCKLYMLEVPGRPGSHAVSSSTDDGFVRKSLLTQWRTRLNLTHRSFANYEGMCVGPKLADGRFVLLLIADSQNRYRGVLHDWIRSIVIDLN